MNLENISYSIVLDSEFSTEKTINERLFYGVYKERKITYVMIKIIGANPKFNGYKEDIDCPIYKKPNMDKLKKAQQMTKDRLEK